MAYYPGLVSHGPRTPGLAQFAKEQCSPAEYRDYVAGIARAIDAINDALMNKAIASHPEINNQIEADLAEFGRIL